VPPPNGAADFEIPRRAQARASLPDFVWTTKTGNLSRLLTSEKQYIPYY
jgi:hypothetical protein